MKNGLQKLDVVRRMKLWSERVQECRSSGKNIRKIDFWKIKLTTAVISMSIFCLGVYCY